MTTPLEEERRRREASGDYLDLVNTDFRAAGFRFPEESYNRAWNRWRVHPEYLPSGRGNPAARAAVADFLTRDGLETTPEQIVLTSGSSISYDLIFRLLRAGGSRRCHHDRWSESPAVALPNPGYPLFEHLANGALLTPLRYNLDHRNGFHLDLGELHRVLARRPLAIVVISPNNPSGAVYRREDLVHLLAMCSETGTPIISDEVFSAYLEIEEPLPRPATLLSTISDTTDRDARPLVFTLNGLSKLCAAPELKAGWIAVHGDPGEVAATIEALDTLHDSYLTVSGFGEAALIEFLRSEAREDRESLTLPIARMRATLRQSLSNLAGVSLPGNRRGAGESGGIHEIFRIDAEFSSLRFGTVDDEEIARTLVRDYGVYVHPGYLYGLDRSLTGEIDPWFVVTALNSTVAISEGLQRLTLALR